MKKILSVLMVIMMLAIMAAPALADVNAARNSVVRIYAELYNPATGETAYSTGTGFAVGEKGKPVEYFVTNTHVIAPTGYSPVSVYILFVDEMNMQLANIKAQSEKYDLSVLSLAVPTDARQAMILRPFDPKEAKDKMIGEAVTAIGFPSISGDVLISGTGAALPSTVNDQSVTNGNVSRIAEDDVNNDGEQIEHTAETSPGNSGGPLVDKNGYLLGVNTWIASDSETSTKMSYALSVNEVVKVLNDAGIKYATAGMNWLLIALIAGAALLLVVIIVVIVLLTSKKGAKGAQGGSARVLAVSEGDLAGQQFPLNGAMTVGRDRRRCQVVYPDNAAGISSAHCVVKMENGVVTVTDLNSSYGTWIDSTKLTPNRPEVWHRGQKLYLGSKKQVLTLHSTGK